MRSRGQSIRTALTASAAALLATLLIALPPAKGDLLGDVLDGLGDLLGGILPGEVDQLLSAKFVTVYDPGAPGGPDQVVKVHGALAELPTAIDVDGDILNLPDVLATFKVFSDGNAADQVELHVTKLPTAPTNLPLSVEVAINDLADPASRVAFGYDTLPLSGEAATSAPANFVGKVNLADTDGDPATENLGVQVTPTGVGPRLAFIGEYYKPQSGTQGYVPAQRTEREKSRVQYSDPVPGWAQIKMTTKGEEETDAELATSAATNVDVELTDPATATTTTGAIDRLPLSPSGKPSLRLHLADKGSNSEQQAQLWSAGAETQPTNVAVSVVDPDGTLDISGVIDKLPAAPASGDPSLDLALSGIPACNGTHNEIAYRSAAPIGHVEAAVAEHESGAGEPNRVIEAALDGLPTEIDVTAGPKPSGGQSKLTAAPDPGPGPTPCPPGPPVTDPPQRVTVAANAPIGNTDVAYAKNGAPERLDGHDLYLVDEPGFQSAWANLAGLEAATVDSGELVEVDAQLAPQELVGRVRSVTPPDPDEPAQLAQTKTYDLRVQDLPAKLNLRLHTFKEHVDQNTGIPTVNPNAGSFRWTGSSTIERLEIDAEGDPALFETPGDAKDAKLLEIDALGVPTKVRGKVTDDRVWVDSEQQGLRGGTVPFKQVAAIATSGPLTQVPGTADGILYEDLTDRWLVSGRVSDLRELDVRASDPELRDFFLDAAGEHKLGLWVNQRPVDEDGDPVPNAAVQKLEGVVTKLMPRTRLQLIEAADSKLIGYSHGGTKKAPRIWVRGEDLLGLPKGTRIAEVELLEVPKALTANFGKGENRSVGLDAHGSTVGTLDALLTGGQEIHWTNQDGVLYRNLDGDDEQAGDALDGDQRAEYDDIVSAQVSDLRAASVDTSEKPTKPAFYLDPTGNKSFDVDLKWRRDEVEDGNLPDGPPQEVSGELSGLKPKTSLWFEDTAYGEDEGTSGQTAIHYQADGVIAFADLLGRNLEGLPEWASDLSIDLFHLPEQLEVRSGHDGDPLLIDVSTHGGTLYQGEVRLASSSDPDELPDGDLPSGFDGFLDHSDNSGRIEIGRVSGLKDLVVSGVEDLDDGFTQQEVFIDAVGAKKLNAPGFNKMPLKLDLREKSAACANTDCLTEAELHELQRNTHVKVTENGLLPNGTEPGRVDLEYGADATATTLKFHADSPAPVELVAPNSYKHAVLELDPVPKSVKVCQAGHTAQCAPSLPNTDAVWEPDDDLRGPGGYNRGSMSYSASQHANLELSADEVPGQGSPFLSKHTRADLNLRELETGTYKYREEEFGYDYVEGTFGIDTDNHSVNGEYVNWAGTDGIWPPAGTCAWAQGDGSNPFYALIDETVFPCISQDDWATYAYAFFDDFTSNNRRWYGWGEFFAGQPIPFHGSEDVGAVDCPGGTALFVGPPENNPTFIPIDSDELGGDAEDMTGEICDD